MLKKFVRISKSFYLCSHETFILLPSYTCFLLRNSAHAHRTVGLPVALLMIAVCWLLSMQLPYNHIIQYLSGHNFTIYIFSWLFQSVVMMLCDRLHIIWYGTFVVMFFTGLLGPMVVIFVYEHLPFLHRRPVRLILGVR